MTFLSIASQMKLPRNEYLFHNETHRRYGGLTRILMLIHEAIGTSLAEGDVTTK